MNQFETAAEQPTAAEEFQSFVARVDARDDAQEVVVDFDRGKWPGQLVLRHVQKLGSAVQIVTVFSVRIPIGNPNSLS